MWSADLSKVLQRSGQACERRKRRNCHKSSVQCGESVMTMIEKPKDKGETHYCIGIMSDLVDRSGEVVVGGAIERVVQARIVCRMPGGAARWCQGHEECQRRAVTAGFIRDS